MSIRKSTELYRIPETFHVAGCLKTFSDTSSEDYTPTRIVIYMSKSISIGRNVKCDYTIDDTIVSSSHCTIYAVQFDPVCAPMVYCHDSSLNGTFINDRLIGKGNTEILTNGDIISICSTEKFKFLSNSAYALPKTKYPEVPNTTVSKFHLSDRVLGVGSFGEVYLAHHIDTRALIACKVSKIVERKGFHPTTEVNILKCLNHPNILAMHETVIIDDKLFLFEELMTGGDLFSYLIGPNDQLRHLPEYEALFICFQILKALKYLHSLNIAHRDLKLDNILLERPFPGSRIVLGDFGIASSLNASRKVMSTVIGTPEYSAPEVGFDHSRKGIGYTLKCDMWSLGVILHILFTGISPFFDEEDVKQTALNASSGEINLNTPEWSTISEKGKDFVKKLLQVNPSNRLSSFQAFNHLWINRFKSHLEDLYSENVFKPWNKQNKEYKEYEF